MVDLQDPSRSMAELQLEPITNIAMVSKKEAPSHYCVVAQTTDGFDADLWKDGIFKSKVKRYLCFTRASSTENQTQLGNVLVDMKLTDLKDTLPEGFTPIQETMDTHELALRRKRMCVKLVPRHSTNTAICDVLIQSRSKQSAANYTFIGELNGMTIWYLMGQVAQTNSAPYNMPSIHQTVPDSSHTPVSRTSSLPKRSTVRPDIEHQNSNSTSGCSSEIWPTHSDQLPSFHVRGHPSA
ncbi:multivesicular body subunit 12Bb isoform X2 [Salminus brasiliensis]|uniref:multivesicular body subunit 12Bb isoform X2 n=1 Tax=Salminus brasiliensis TaxID=930266 RepID=UPI003B82C825